MIPSQRILKLFFLSTILVCCVSACETKQALERQMDKIVGDYRLEIYPDELDAWAARNPAKMNAVLTAHLFQDGDEWLFEYVVPLSGGGSGTPSFHQIRQRIFWDRQLGDYFFYPLATSDLPAGMKAESVSTRISTSYIYFSSSESPKVYLIWTKTR
jgi:hypothetical protein